MQVLYELGRHHPSMVLLPDGRIVMTYGARKGNPKTSDGFIQFSIEAVVSRDHGQSWDLDHRHILHRWPATFQSATAWRASCQCTSSVLLPTGSILTAFGTGYRIHPSNPGPRDVGLIQWQALD
jgi:hypothetical protein